MITAIVIDDDVDTVDVFCDYLEIVNVKVVGRGHNGKTAVELYQKHNPDVVFLDLMMPDYDGFYALENIRKINPAAKVVVVTADLRRDTIDRLNILKPTEVFIKPYDINKISELLAKI
ncbi:MAG: response regulator [Thaumarchaeota archaeon]|nr:response regulator [Nitrososphaerota archaeon]